MGETIVDVRDLTKVYEASRVTAVDGISSFCRPL
jgi:hypothetical protein